MSLRSFGSGSGKGQRRLAVEALERRSMLAGNVAVDQVGPHLFIRGDNNDNMVVVTQVDDGEYVVFGLDADDFESLPEADFQSGPTNITGDGEDVSEEFGFSARLFTGVSGVIDIDTKKGDDIVLIGNNEDDINTLSSECLGFAFGSGSGDGGGNGTFSGEALVDIEPVEGRFFAPNSLIINTGDGNDSVVVNADVRIDTVINTGKGFDGVAFGSTLSLEIPMLQEGPSLVAQQQFEEVPNVGDDVVIITGSQDDEVCVQGTVIHGDLVIQTNDGNDDVFVGGVGAGAMTVATGNQNDFVEMQAFFTERTVVVDTGAGNDEVDMSFFIAGIDLGAVGALNEGELPEAVEDLEEFRTFAGYVTVVTGAGNDEAELFTLIADGVHIDTGAGNDGTPFRDESPITVEEAIIANHLNVITGAGNDFVLVEEVEAGNILVNTGAGNDGSSDMPIEIYNVFTDTDLVVDTGAGNDFAYIYSGDGEEEVTSEIGRNLVLNMGAGNDAAQVVDLIIGNDLIAVLGAGDDDAFIGTSGSLGVQTGAIEIGRNLVLDAGAGNDDVEIGDTHAGNDATLVLGAGNDGLSIFDSSARRNALIDAGAGADEVSLNNVDVGDEEDENTGLAQIFMGAGNDELSIFNSFTRKLRAFGGSGRDTFNTDFDLGANGDYDVDGDGDIDAVIREFEEFNAEENT